VACPRENEVAEKDSTVDQAAVYLGCGKMRIVNNNWYVDVLFWYVGEYPLV
jgi:hypothetical protein